MSSGSRIALNILAGGRFLVGISTLLAPLQASRLLYVPLHPNDAFVGRLFGSRDLVLSLAVLYGAGEQNGTTTGGGPGTKTTGRQYLRWAITLGIIIDAIDTVSGLVEWGNGRISGEGALLGAGGAALLTVLGYIGLGAA